jgi:uncharacterized protein YozE (UPF0346 family)
MPTDKVISILGLKQSGKSTFLTVLNLSLALEESPWRIRPKGTTIRVMAELMDSLFNKGLYPEQTQIETDMCFVVEKEATYLGLKPGAYFELHAADVPGEAVKGVSSDVSIYHNFYENHLKGCSGVIFLLDPKEAWLDGTQAETEFADNYFPLFSSILAEIGEYTDTNPYFVFCVTKVDLMEGPNSQFDKEGYLEDVESLAGKILGRSTKAVIDQSIDLNHIYWLPVSATGFTGEGEKRTTQFVPNKGSSGESGIKNPRDLKPIGVAEALGWVLDKLADDDEEVRIIRTRGKKYSDLVKGFRRLFGI